MADSDGLWLVPCELARKSLHLDGSLGLWLDGSLGRLTWWAMYVNCMGFFPCFSLAILLPENLQQPHLSITFVDNYIGNESKITQMCNGDMQITSRIPLLDNFLIKSSRLKIHKRELAMKRSLPIPLMTISESPPDQVKLWSCERDEDPWVLYANCSGCIAPS
ncbi:hypothetical protein VNO77_03843 [Canavalia gladiata]|uniref:Uncharacterized protein n=1 Tax=Canavalia gladiata TaxID=3824 RepID=A0AAN9R780_CANGL